MARDESRGSRRARVSVTGTGRVERAADVAHATFVVEASRPTASEARAVGAARAAAVLAALADAGVAEVDLRTAGLQLSPTWEHREGRDYRTGFTVTNRVAATVRRLETVGRVLDAGLEAGATGLDGVTFDLEDPAADTTEARRLAVLDARSRAKTIARAAGQGLGRLVEIREPGATAMDGGADLRMARFAMAAPTPLLPGAVEVSVSVTAEWELERA